jgi:D-lactate dehydrogenase
MVLEYMTKLKISHFSLADWEKAEILAKLPDFDHVFVEDQNVENNLAKIDDCDILDVFIYSDVNTKVINSLTNLRLIVTRSTGFNHIDTQAAKSKNILVCNVPAYGTATVAEHTFALLLSLSKQIPTISNRTKSHNFDFQDKLGFDLEGKTIGIIGAGKIGKHVITIAKGFGMKVLAHDIYKDLEFAKQNNFEYVEFEELLQKSDILSLHTPANDYTCSLLTRFNIDKIKPGAVFINTSRGCLVKNEDLVYALDKGIISACGLDTVDGEEDMFVSKPYEYQKILLAKENVLYTPHSAFFTKEAIGRILQTTIENIQKFRDEKPTNLV